ncbi:hypothetical protein [Longimycelium tulufanense]|uniref:hypothetical protein n=1 Tax=Longimycelium tulufanense TaxID=907463 RepID=UPI001666C93F|nr:hypothetical protein [Longimycelium tulufanense]
MSLSVYLRRLCWSPERLAREINRVAGAGTISPKAPYGWLKGAYPRGNVPDIVAEILSIQLHEDVTVNQVWPTRRSGQIDSPHGALASTTGNERSSRLDTDHLDTWMDESAPSETAPLPGAHLISAAVDWLTEPLPPPRPQPSGVELTSEALELIDNRIAQLRHLDDTQGGPLVLDWIRHDLRWVSGLLRNCSYDRFQAVRLHQHMAELAQLAGWLAADLGRHGNAQRYLLVGLRAASKAGDRQLGAHILSCLSYQAAWNGLGKDALRLVRLARKGVVDPLRGRLSALLATREARAHANLMDVAAFQRAAAEAAESYASAGSVVDPSWASWVVPAVLAADEGRSWLDMGQPQRAEPELVRGLTLFGDEQPRNRLLHTISLAEARLDLGELDGAAEAVHAALELTSHLSSKRVRDRLAKVHAALARLDSASSRAARTRIEDVLGPRSATIDMGRPHAC